MLKKLFHACFSSEDRQGRGLSARQTNEGIQTNVRALYDDNKRLHSALPVPVFDGHVSTPAPLTCFRYGRAQSIHLPPRRIEWESSHSALVLGHMTA